MATTCGFIVAASGSGLEAAGQEHQHQAPAKKAVMIAGTSEVLRSVPKRFAIVKGLDPAHSRVTLLIEGENLPKVWTLNADAEVKVAGWWGRLEQFKVGDRVWAWFQLDRRQQPIGILMLADELSEQDIHGPGVKLEARQGVTLTLKSAEGKTRSLNASGSKVYRGQDEATLDSLRQGETIFVQSAGDRARVILDQAAFEARQHAQQAALRKRWLEHGLPGTVIFVHLSGEMELMVDHEGLRWARYLKPGDKVTLAISPLISAQVQRTRPWRERTQVRLVVGGSDLADLHIGQRVYLRMPAPPPAVENSALPTDMGRPRSTPQRIEWLLASVYCPCGVKGDICTGDFYTLASCNPNGCGMPNLVRQEVARKIAKGLTDKQILEELLKEHGPRLLHQHLRP